jgi:hypothetical protein
MTGPRSAHAPTGIPQHDDTHYPCTFTTRGNPTSFTTYTNASAPSGSEVKNSYYDMFGNLVQAQVDCCQLTTWSFSTTTEYAYPDSKTCYFFSRAGLAPGEKFHITGTPMPAQIGPHHPGAPVGKAHAEFRLLFVQFTDGSTFGNSAWGDSLENERTMVVGDLKSFSETYNEKGGKALTDAVMSATKSGLPSLGIPTILPLPRKN